MDEQKEMLKALWVKAGKALEPLRVPCKTVEKATRLRFALYNAVKAVRKEKEPATQELLDAITNCSVGFDAQDKTVLVIQRKVMSDMMQTLAELIGTVPPAEDNETQASLERLQSKLNTSAEEPNPGRKTPYYTREG